MNTRTCNIARSLWRFIEVFLFFVVSVVGFNILFKTSSLNSKSKVKQLSEGMVAPRELSLPEVTMLFDTDHLTGYFSHSPHKSSLSISSRSTVHRNIDVLHYFYKTLLQSNPIETYSSFFNPSFHCKPVNILLQSCILLI
jgi:hypothetical protein